MDLQELNIRQFKLVSGESIIALVSHDNANNYVIERPVVVYANMVGGYQFADWFPFSKQKVYSLAKFNIVGDVSVIEDVKATYIKFALGKKPIPRFQSDHDAMEALTKTVMDRLGIEDEELEFTEDPTPDTKKEIIH